MSGIIGTGGRSGVIGRGSREGWVLLQSSTGTAASHAMGSAATLTTLYDDYMIVGSSIKMATAEHLVFTATIGGTDRVSDWETVSHGRSAADYEGSTRSNASDYAFITGGYPQNNNATDKSDFQLFFSKPTISTYYHLFRGQSVLHNSQGDPAVSQFAATNYDFSGALTVVTIKGPATNNVTGEIKLYGLSK